MSNESSLISFSSDSQVHFPSDKKIERIQQIFDEIYPLFNFHNDMVINLKFKNLYDSPYTCLSKRTTQKESQLENDSNNINIFGTVVMTPIILSETFESIVSKANAILDPRSKRTIFNTHFPYVEQMIRDTGYYSENRIRFILAHELSHFKNNDLSVWSQLKLKVLSVLNPDKAQKMFREKEFLADALAIQICGEPAIYGSIEHLAKSHILQSRVDKILTHNQMHSTLTLSHEHRNRTHPEEKERAERIIAIAHSKFGITSETIFEQVCLKGIPIWNEFCVWKTLSSPNIYDLFE